MRSRTFNTLRYAAVALVLSVLLAGCAAPAVMLVAAGPGMATVGYAALPGDLEVEYRNEQPAADIDRLTRVQRVITTDPDTYTTVKEERLFHSTTLANASVPHPRTNEEAAALARSHDADAFIRAVFTPSAAGSSSGFMGLQELLGEYTVSIVTADGHVVYSQTAVLSKKMSTLNNKHFPQAEIRKHLVGAFVHNLKTQGLEVAAE